MKKLFSRAAAGLLIFASLFASSCAAAQQTAQTSAPAGQTSDTSAETTSGETGRADVADNLPDLDFDGTTISVFDNTAYPDHNKYITGPEEQTGEVVDDAIYDRNRKVCDRLNISFVYSDHNDDLGTVAGNVKKFVAAGDDEYDVVSAAQFAMISLSTSGYFYNALKLQYLDFTQPWWASKYMEALSIGTDTRFFLVGDYFLEMLLGTRVLYFNKALYQNYYGDPEQQYQTVLDGKFTLDYFTAQLEAVYSDLNGDGTADIDDQYGFMTYGAYSSVDPFAFATDVKLTDRDSDGYVTLNIVGNSRAEELTGKLLKIFYNKGSYIFDPANPDDTYNYFTAGKVLYIGNAAFDDAVKLRAMTDDYGILPYPKYDESQENYQTIVHDAYALGVVPVTCGELDKIGAVLEAMSAETYRTVIDAYYETALKTKYVRDEASSKVVDMVHGSVTAEFAFAYYSVLGNSGQIFRTLVSGNKSDYASAAAKSESKAEKALAKLIAAYDEAK
jgi:hypothetical protein